MTIPQKVILNEAAEKMLHLEFIKLGFNYYEMKDNIIPLSEDSFSMRQTVPLNVISGKDDVLLCSFMVSAKEQSAKILAMHATLARFTSFKPNKYIPLMSNAYLNINQSLPAMRQIVNESIQFLDKFREQEALTTGKYKNPTETGCQLEEQVRRELSKLGFDYSSMRESIRIVDKHTFTVNYGVHVETTGMQNDFLMITFLVSDKEKLNTSPIDGMYVTHSRFSTDLNKTINLTEDYYYANKDTLPTKANLETKAAQLVRTTAIVEKFSVYETKPSLNHDQDPSKQIKR